MSTFTGDITKLVAAAMLQDFLIDKDGTPMSAGTITMYHDNSRTTLKNWYYQSGTPGNYTYITLPNPLTLSAAGTICDINGVDTIPFYYPWSETDDNVPDPYYVTIVNHAMTNQITRANFPFEGGTGGGGGDTTGSFNNLITNGSFWRNIQPNTLNVIPYVAFTYSATNMPIPPGGTLPSVIVAPGNHDGFRMPDVEFLKDSFSVGTDSVTFVPFPASTTLPISNPATVSGEYYLSHTGGVTTGVTQKCYQFPISLHLNSLANVPFTFTIQAQNDPIGGSTAIGANVISIFIFQDTGTGGTPAAAAVPIAQFTLTSSWKTYSVISVFPSAAGLTVGAGADDGLYLQVQMPLTLACQINFTKPSIYLNSTGMFPTSDYQTYDEVDSIINTPRTGDIRTSINSFYFYGWVPMNNGTIGNAASNAKTRGNADTWQLYNLIWNITQTVNSINGASINPIFTSAGSVTTYGATAYADFTANKALSLTKMMGNVMLGSVPAAALLPATPSIIGYTSTVTASSSSGVLWTTSASNRLNLYLGNTVTFTSTAALANVTAKQVYFIIPVSSTTFRIALTFGNALAGIALAYTGAESGTVAANIQPTTTYEGEYSHVLRLSEMVNHTHNPLNGVGFLDEDAALNLAFGASTSATSAGTTGLITNYPASGQLPLNVTQPGTFYNMFIKL